MSTCNIEKARAALKARLFVPRNTYGLNKELHQVIERPECYNIELYEIDGVYVGVAISRHTPLNGDGTRKKYENVEVFVRKAHRRKGIGSALVKKLRNGRNILRAGAGVKGSQQFWLGLDVRPFYCPYADDKSTWKEFY